MGGISLRRDAKILADHDPVSLSAPEALPGMARDRTRTAAVRGSPLTSSDLVQYVKVLFCRIFLDIRYCYALLVQLLRVVLT